MKLLRTVALRWYVGSGAVLIAVLLLLSPLAISALTAQVPTAAKARARDVHLTIETDRSTYHVGDAVKVRLAYTNTSNVPIEYFADAPWQETELIVSENNGQRVSSTLGRGPSVPTSGAPSIIPPHHTGTLGLRGHEWFSLRSWGYDLRGPGTYAIVGIPQITGPDMELDYRTVRSNTATFRIVP